MKYTSFSLLAVLASVSAFVPAQQSARVSTEQAALADKIFGLDLFAPNPDVNTYGARKKKNLKQGKLTDSSYVPSGLTKAQYEKIRAAERKRKDDNYAMNVKKAFKYQDFTEWYAKRGTEEAGSWLKSVTLGHTMAKTKYDWSGVEDAKKFESTNVGTKKAAAAKKATAKKKAEPKTTFLNLKF